MTVFRIFLVLYTTVRKLRYISSPKFMYNKLGGIQRNLSMTGIFTYNVKAKFLEM
jgi:hypothetical protein